MAAPRLTQTKPRTKLARQRVARGMTQQEMWEATGLTRAMYLRYEQGLVTDPRLFPLVNCARVLGVALEEICEDGWLEWHIFDATNAPTPPTPAAPQ
jgi:transcriptional regulator with XRE-family HTH domain